MKALDALKLLAEGKRMRRNFWEASTYIELKGSLIYDNNGFTNHLIVIDTSTDDWEVYEESKPKKQVWQWRVKPNYSNSWYVDSGLYCESEAKKVFDLSDIYEKHAGPFEVDE